VSGPDVVKVLLLLVLSYIVAGAYVFGFWCIISERVCVDLGGILACWCMMCSYPSSRCCKWSCNIVSCRSITCAILFVLGLILVKVLSLHTSPLLFGSGNTSCCWEYVETVGQREVAGMR